MLNYQRVFTVYFFWWGVVVVLHCIKTCIKYCTILQLYMFVLHDRHFWDLFGLCVFVARVALDDVWDSRF